MSVYIIYIRLENMARSKEQWNDLISQVQSNVPNLELGDQAWYILIVRRLR